MTRGLSGTGAPAGGAITAGGSITAAGAGTTGTATIAGTTFREFMSGFPTGVAVVTTLDRTGRPHGFTCSSLCSVTVDPPTLLVCVDNRSGTLAAIEARAAFAVNLLHGRAHPAARVFASGAPDRFAGILWRPGPRTGLPHLADDAHHVADCDLVDVRVVGDHSIVLGRVSAVTGSPGDPLLYGRRRYATWSTAGEPVDRLVAAAVLPGSEIPVPQPLRSSR